MSLNPIEAARKRLLRFRLPERAIEYNARGIPVKRHNTEELLGRFASLAAGFARALEAAGADKGLERRSALFGKLTAPGSAFDKARRSAYEKINRAVEPFKPPGGSLAGQGAARPRRKINLTGPSPRASGWELIANQYRQVERFVGDLDSIAWHLPKALAYADRLVDRVPSGPGSTSLRLWRDELFRLKTQDDAGHLLGCRLIVRCRDALDGEGNSYDSYQEVIAFLSGDPPRFVQAVQDAAVTLGSEVPEAPQRAPASKRSSARRPPAKSKAAEQPPTPDAAVPPIERWTDLAVGIHEKGFYAIFPRPVAGDVVAITKAHKLSLRGKRWPKVLKVFAESADGTHARKDALLFELGYLQYGQTRMVEALEKEADGPPRGRGAVAPYDDDLREFRPLLKLLTSTMADLGRELRAAVKCPQPGPFESLHLDYRAAFTTGYLLKDAAGRLRFRRVPDQGR
jgi:hypothetical protein